MGGAPLLIPELSWMLVGEQMDRGFILYRDIWDNVSPLSGLTYWSLDYLFGRSQLAYQIAACIVSIIQLVYFNHVLNSREVFLQRNYVPGAIYAIFLNISFDLSTLSPMLLATTFLLFAFGKIVKILVTKEAPTQVFEMGFYIGLASLFYLPASVFMIWGCCCLLFYTGASFRQYLLGAFGSIFPMMALAGYFYSQNGLDSLNRNLLSSVFQVKQYELNDFSFLIISLFLPLVFGMLGYFRIFANFRFVNYQTRVQQVMTLWFLAALLTIPLMEFLAPMQFIIFIPPTAFFATHYFQSFRKKNLSDDFQFTFMVAAIILIQYQGLMGLIPGITTSRLESLQVKPAVLPAELKDKRILVLGYHEGEYLNNFSATPYLNWELASYDLENLDHFDSVIHVNDNFRKDPPDYVIDKVNIMPELLYRVPTLKSQYVLSPWKGIYQRKGI